RADARGEPNVRSTLTRNMQEEPIETRVRPAPHPAPPKWKPASAITHPELLPILATQHASLSASALEHFLQCPFQFFALKTLRLREFPARPEDRLNFLVMGSVVHQFLSEWYVERPPFESLFDRIFHEACEKERVPPGYRTE